MTNTFDLSVIVT